ncbi:MAG: TonB family protein [Acidobacteriia bacterium]|nr:TonB family protein [Terriglobia bacterium]
MVSAPVSIQPSRVPQLALQKTGWLAQFISSLRVLVREPASPKKFLGGAYFRDCWIDQRFPKQAFAAAVALQILLILFPPPIWSTRPPRVVAPPPDTEFTWFGPAHDLPAISPPALRMKSAPKMNVPKTRPDRGADSFHPRQTILSTPLHPTHPRQTLIQPAAPQEPPKILPALPNIVQLAGSQPVRPKLALMAMRPAAPSHLAAADASAPDLAVPDNHLGAISIAASAHAPPKPLLPVSSMSAPRAAAQRGDTTTAAPEISGRTGDSATLIALSATPAPAPPPAIPAGNLSARISISPDGPQPGAPGGNAAGNSAGAAPGISGGGHGPNGIFISGGNASNPSATSGLGIGAASRGLGNPLPSRPMSRALAASEDSHPRPLNSAGSVKDISKLDVPPEKVLGAKQVYTLHVNMPNLTSASGSWILNFAELNEDDAPGYPKGNSADLAGPVPFRKVDPKYPPELRTLHVDGEVVLYAIIRKDGSVDSIQLVHSVDPRLDTNAMEALAQWKFRPAEKRGEPVDLEAVVYIPFRSRTPGF